MSTLAFFKGILANERDIFVRVIAAVPESGLDYRVDPKARSAGEIIGHMIGHNLDIVELVTEGTIHHRNQVEFGSVESGVEMFGESFDEMLKSFESVDDERWNANGKFFVGDHEAMAAPCEQLAWMMYFDMIHHRGQLSTYLRPMGSKVPSIYGPSADEQG